MQALLLSSTYIFCIASGSTQDKLELRDEPQLHALSSASYKAQISSPKALLLLLFNYRPVHRFSERIPAFHETNDISMKVRRDALGLFAAFATVGFPKTAPAAVTPGIEPQTGVDAYAVPRYLDAEVALPSKKPIVISQVLRRWKEGDFEVGDATGAYMWPGGVSLSKGSSTGALKTKKFQSLPVRGKRILELGSGTGVAGVGALIGGAEQVVFTDGNPKLVELEQRNAEQNLKADELSRADFKQLRWGNEEDEAAVLSAGPFDIIFATEVAYLRSSLPALFGTVQRCLRSALNSGVAKPVAIIQSAPDLSDAGDSTGAADGKGFRGMDGVIAAAKKEGLALASITEVDETARVVFMLAETA